MQTNPAVEQSTIIH